MLHDNEKFRCFFVIVIEIMKFLYEYTNWIFRDQPSSFISDFGIILWLRMKKEILCPSCNMVFSENIRLERHVKKAHPPKRRTDPNPSADFNHADISHTHFSL